MKLQHRVIHPRLAKQCFCTVKPTWIQSPTHYDRTSTSVLRLASTSSHTRTRTKLDATPFALPEMRALDLAHAKKAQHVQSASQHLAQHGILKINLDFPDPESRYLEQLVLSLNEYHGHQLPITHSASKGWFWDVRPNSKTTSQTPQHQARSETMEEFPWHTDCSYEDLPPRYFALHVLQHDRFGGGTLSVMNVQKLSERLSTTTRSSLMKQDYGIKIPMEFIKDPEKREIVGSILTSHPHTQDYMMRFRRDLVTPLTETASRALNELDSFLRDAGSQAQLIIHLNAGELSTGSIIFVDNRRWLHARNNINDPERHLRRVRWDAVPFHDAHVE